MSKLITAFHLLKDNKVAFLKALFENLNHIGLLNCLSDEMFIRISYFCYFGKRLNLRNPRTFTEKLQWLKLNDRNSSYPKMVDKFEVKTFVANRIGEEFVIPTYGIWDKPEDIDWDKLPERFVLKNTKGSGGHDVIICKDKKELDIEKTIRILNNSIKSSDNFFYYCREWPYKHIKPRIIAEALLSETPDDGCLKEKDLLDYKIFCFDGEPKFLFVATGRQKKDTRFDFYDLSFNHLPFTNGHPNADVYPVRPKNYELMLDIARKLSDGMPHVRVDLYNINGKIYFGELTFYHWGGMVPFEPDEWDKKFGELLNINSNKK